GDLGAEHVHQRVVAAGEHPDRARRVVRRRVRVVVLDVASRDEALKWAAKIAVSCRCAQEVREIMPDPETEAMLRAAGR
ncbi:hypothetical protein ACFWD8_05495, partial [Micromonospora aurantiaca]